MTGKRKKSNLSYNTAYGDYSGIMYFLDSIYT